MPTTHSPVAISHLSASRDWYCVFAVPLPNGGLELHREPVLGFRFETYAVDLQRDHFDAVVPIIASGSISKSEVYLLQLGQVYFTGDQQLRTRDEAIDWFRKQRA